VSGELLEVVAEFTVGEAKEIGVNLRGVPVTFDVSKHELSCLDRKAGLEEEDGKVRLRFMVDRTSIDIFGNNGRVYMPMGVLVPADNKSLQVYSKGGNAQINSLEVFDLKSAWK
jgi:sucrose-6-phosphate hydrolase SacC (GH32 family)